MRNVDDMVLDNQEQQMVGAVPDPVGVKSILFSVHEDEALEPRLQSVLALARACSAHLHFLHVVPIEGYTVVDPNGAAFASGEIARALESEAATLRERLESRLAQEDVSWSYEQVTSSILPEILRGAALSDLVVMGRLPSWNEYSRTSHGLLGAFLCSTRTPLLVPGDENRPFNALGMAVIAWNGSYESANAIRSNLGLLRMAAEVRVVRFKDSKPNAFPDTRVLEYLSRHGVHAEIETHLRRTDVAGDLINLAERHDADFIVMGGYSHSRAGEFLFGGVTRDLLRACPISLVMAH